MHVRHTTSLQYIQVMVTLFEILNNIYIINAYPTILKYIYRHRVKVVFTSDNLGITEPSNGLRITEPSNGLRNLRITELS